MPPMTFEELEKWYADLSPMKLAELEKWSADSLAKEEEEDRAMRAYCDEVRRQRNYPVPLGNPLKSKPRLTLIQGGLKE
jgi:hypothetical protein